MASPARPEPQIRAERLLTMVPMADQWLEEITEGYTGLIDGESPDCQGSPEAAKYLYVVAGLEAKTAEISRIAQGQREAVAQWEEDEKAKLQRQINWLSQGLEGYIRAAGEKTISLPNGKLKVRAQAAQLDVDEEIFFSAFGKDSPFVSVIPAKLRPDKKALREHIKGTGEIPTGVTWEPRDSKFSYTVAE